MPNFFFAFLLSKRSLFIFCAQVQRLDPLPCPNCRRPEALAALAELCRRPVWASRRVGVVSLGGAGGWWVRRLDVATLATAWGPSGVLAAEPALDWHADSRWREASAEAREAAGAGVPLFELGPGEAVVQVR